MVNTWVEQDRERRNTQLEALVCNIFKNQTLLTKTGQINDHETVVTVLGLNSQGHPVLTGRLVAGDRHRAIAVAKEDSRTLAHACQNEWKSADRSWRLSRTALAVLLILIPVLIAVSMATQSQDLARWLAVSATMTGAVAFLMGVFMLCNGRNDDLQQRLLQMSSDRDPYDSQDLLEIQDVITPSVRDGLLEARAWGASIYQEAVDRMVRAQHETIIARATGGIDVR